MSHRTSSSGREPLRPQSSSSTAHPTLSHRISDISDFAEAEAPLYDDEEGDASTGISPGRGSLATLQEHQTDHKSHETDHSPGAEPSASALQSPRGSLTWTSSFPYPGKRRYVPLPQASRRKTKGSSKHGSLLGRSISAGVEHEEEEIDLSLLSSAAAMGQDISRPASPAGAETQPRSAEAGGVPAAIIPGQRMRSKQFQLNEARGTLTGGIGSGFKVDYTLKDEELLSSPVGGPRNMARSFTVRKSVRGLTRAETIKSMGQQEANRSGQVIEVVTEDPALQDLSTMLGPTTVAEGELRQSTFPAKQQTTQVFYPQPNWKPFAMRWPYLSCVIFLSTALAVMQEFLFRKYRGGALLEFRKPQEVSPSLYFAAKFAPTLLAVVFGVLWQFVDFEVRRLEAFYQLSKKGGALASESINVDYVTSFSFFRPFRALRLRHYAVALSSTATILAVSLVPTFAAASVVLTPERKERVAHPDGVKELHLESVWSRLLTVSLGLCAAFGLGLLCILQTRRSGLLSDVRGIAGLASMAVVSHILMDFKDLDTAKPNDIHHKLKRNRYMLRNSSIAPDDENTVFLQGRSRHQDVSSHLPENPHPLMLRPAGSVPFMCALVLFTAFIPIFLFTPAAIVAEKAAFLITACAVGLKLAWNALETSVRMMEPFYLLSRRHASSKVLTLDYTALPFGWMPLQALYNGHFLVFLVGFGSVMTEILTILVTGLATVDGSDFFPQSDKGSSIDSGQETRVSFYVSLGLSIFILMYMCVVCLIVFVRRRHPYLPRQPCTIASILAFIHQSKMLYDFVGTEKLSTRQMRARLADRRQTYGLGWFEGRDGGAHCGVDEEELLGNYRHGIDFAKGNNPWNMEWGVW